MNAVVRSRRLSLALMAVFVAAAAFAGPTGCAPRGPGPFEGRPVEPPSTHVGLYFGDKDASGLVYVTTLVPVQPGDTYETLAVRALIDGPPEGAGDLIGSIPEGTRLLSLRIKDGVAFVNFSREFVDNHWGGSAGELLTIYSVVNTLTEEGPLRAVQFLVEGEVLESLAGHVETHEPLERDTQFISGPGANEGTDMPISQGEPGADSVVVVLYFAEVETLKLVRVEREVPMAAGDVYEELALQALISGPGASGLGKVVPDGTELLSLRIEDGVAWVNFNAVFRDDHWGGSAGEALTIFGVVNTLTESPGVTVVRFLIEGEPMGSLAGHIDLEEFTRGEDMIAGDD